MNNGTHTVFPAGEKTVDLFCSGEPDRPVVVLCTFEGEGRAVWETLCGMDCPAFSLAAVSGLNWNHDLVPWDSPAIYGKGDPFTGGAEDFLERLCREIVPRCVEQVPGTPPWLGLAGYSLAGLFALWALYHTDRFARAASVSGSLWFPGFQAYAQAGTMQRKPDGLYFSLGDRESRTRNAVLQTVQARTEELAAFYRNQRIPTVLAYSPGNHFQDPARRTAQGIRWLLCGCPGEAEES